jgi:uncharacterized protein
LIRRQVTRPASQVQNPESQVEKELSRQHWPVKLHGSLSTSDAGQSTGSSSAAGPPEPPPVHAANAINKTRRMPRPEAASEPMRSNRVAPACAPSPRHRCLGFARSGKRDWSNRVLCAGMHTHHAIDYIEITVADVAAAKRFYGTAFGWSFNDYGPGYAGIKGDGREVGGFKQGTTIPGGPLIVLYSSDLAASLAAVRSAGGAIAKEPFAFPGGRRFEFTDPSGNLLAVWSEA